MKKTFIHVTELQCVENVPIGLVGSDINFIAKCFMKETIEILVNLMCIYNQSEKLLKLILRQELYNTSPRTF